MRITLHILIIVVLMVCSAANATPSGSNGGDAVVARWTDCMSTEGDAITGVITGGMVSICMAFPTEVSKNTDRYRIDVSVRGPPLAGGATLTLNTDLQVSTAGPNGCAADTEAGNLQVASTYNNAWGFGRSISQRMRMDGSYCTGVYRVTVSVTPAVGSTVVIIDHFFGFNVISRQYQQYIFHALCDNTVTLAGVGSNLFTTCPEQSLSVDVVDDTTADGMLTVPVADLSSISVNATTTIMGNLTITNPPAEDETLDLGLYVLLLSLSLFLIYMGEARGLVGAKVFGSLLLMVTAGVAMWQAQELGFTEIPGLLGPFVAFTLMLGGYFLLKPAFNDENYNKPSQTNSDEGEKK